MTAAAMIDLDHLEKYVVGDVALRDEILSIFGDQVHGWRDTAHSIKGAARGIGAWVLGDLCAEAETLTGKIPGKNEKRAALLVSLRRQLETTLGEAKRLRDIN